MYSSDEALQQQLSVKLTADEWERVTSDELLNSAESAGQFTWCSGSDWKAPQHAVFQASHAILLLSFVIPNTRRTVLFIHSTLVAGKN